VDVTRINDAPVWRCACRPLKATPWLRDKRGDVGDTAAQPSVYQARKFYLASSDRQFHVLLVFYSVLNQLLEILGHIALKNNIVFQRTSEEFDYYEPFIWYTIMLQI
jgi:hypothetical protein